MNVVIRAVAIAAVLALMPTGAAADLIALGFSGAAPGAVLPTGWNAYPMSRHRPAAKLAIVADDGESVFAIDANDAAGGIEHALDIPAATTLSWRWKVDHAVANADLTKKAGDDFAARVYVFFAVPPSRLTWLQRMKLAMAGRALGITMPTAALCYVWDNQHAVGTMAPNVYFDQVRTVVLQSGDANAATWQPESRDLAADFRLAFGYAPPSVTGIALASDTDNTGGHVKAWFGDVTLAPAKSKRAPVSFDKSRSARTVKRNASR